jgi:hypothetical protein
MQGRLKQNPHNRALKICMQNADFLRKSASLRLGLVYIYPDFAVASAGVMWIAVLFGIPEGARMLAPTGVKWHRGQGVSLSLAFAFLSVIPEGNLLFTKLFPSN